jgi:hypothetical protein
MPHSSTQLLTLTPNTTLNVNGNGGTLNATLNTTLNGRLNATPIVKAPIVEAFNDGTFNVEALNVEALNDGTFNVKAFIDGTFNDRALDVYTLFLFKFIKNFASQVALGGSKFAYLCGHIT